MAPLPANSTNVLFVDYTTGARAHTLQIRFAGASPTTAAERVFDFLDTLKLVLADGFRVTGARYRPSGSVITLPANEGDGLRDFVGESGQGISGVNEAREFVWVGRGRTSGRRVEVSLYGLTLGTPDDFRYDLAGGPPSLGAAAATLPFNPLYWTSIGGDPVAWQNYVNVNYNSYWESRSRRG